MFSISLDFEILRAFPEMPILILFFYFMTIIFAEYEMFAALRAYPSTVYVKSSRDLKVRVIIASLHYCYMNRRFLEKRLIMSIFIYTFHSDFAVLRVNLKIHFWDIYCSRGPFKMAWNPQVLYYSWESFSFRAARTHTHTRAPINQIHICERDGS